MTTFSGALGLAALLAAAACGKAEKPSAPPPPEVEVAVAIRRDVPVVSEWIGTTAGSVDAQVRARVAGYLVARRYREGAFVHAGDVLFEIDKRPLEARRAEAAAQLERAKAELERMRIQVGRYRPLAASSAISQQELDDAVQSELAAKASVSAGEAALEHAQLDLEFATITAPVDGIAGIAKAQQGDLVGPGSTEVLTTISSLDPIRVYFPVSEQEYLRAASRLTTATALPESERPAILELVLADGSTWPERGILAFAGREVDPSTGTIQVAGLFPNSGNILRPGAFVKVRAVTRVKQGAILVPEKAVAELQGQEQVIVVGEGDKAEVRTVRAGERFHGMRVIDEGVREGERVVVVGGQAVRSGARVRPRPAPRETARTSE
jgi:membrane fusion protein (multidrug efflux system)